VTVNQPASAGAVDGVADGVADAADAVEFLRLFHREAGQPFPLADRIARVRRQISRTGTYRQTAAELTFGAKVAWRNHTRCVGKLYWRTLVVRDARHLQDPAEIGADLLDHLRLAGNGGRIEPVITVFAADEPGRPGPRLANPQLLRYAGHRRPDGTVLGDPATAALTDRARALGWDPGPPGPFDLLPLLVDVPGQPGRCVDVPRELALEVPIRHPAHPELTALGLRWYGFPTVSDMQLQLAGLTYRAAPFTGWYVGTEIGARNLADRDRYDLLPAVAAALGLDTSSERTLWKDRALVELTAAVLWSYRQAGVRMVDHHTASDQFDRYTQAERRAGRTVHADWAWIVPPLSPATTALYHQRYDDTVLLPNFVRQTRPGDGDGRPGSP
jgi:nitric-oxide synthase